MTLYSSENTWDGAAKPRFATSLMFGSRRQIFKFAFILLSSVDMEPSINHVALRAGDGWLPVRNALESHAINVTGDGNCEMPKISVK